MIHILVPVYGRYQDKDQDSPLNTMSYFQRDPFSILSCMSTIVKNGYIVHVQEDGTTT
jgi:hypothetical protein